MAIERSIRINVEAGRAKQELNQLSRSFQQTDKAAGKLSRTSTSLTRAANTLGIALARLFSIQSAKSALNVADGYQQLRQDQDFLL
jgi:hypothetical protein